MSYRPERRSGLVVPVSQRMAVVLLALLPDEATVHRRIRNLPKPARDELLTVLDTMRAAARLHRVATGDGRPEACQDAGEGASVMRHLGASSVEGTMSAGAAAEALGVSARRVRQLLDSGALDGSKHGHVWLISAESVAAYIEMKDAS